MSSFITEFPCSSVKSFIKLLRRHGEILTLDQMYARDNKECGKITMGIVKKKYKLQDKGKRKLMKIVLKEVYSNGHEGKLFPVFLFDSFAIAVNNKVKLNDYVAFRSVFVENCTSYYRQKDHQELQALLGCPLKAGANILLMVDSKNKNPEESHVVSAKRRKVDEKSKSPRCDTIEAGERMYDYTKISEVTNTCSNINMYGIVKFAPKNVKGSWKSIIVRIIDETCEDGFRIHIFRGSDNSRLRIEEGDIVRFHRVKIEWYNGEFDGRIFKTSDMVVFPRRGNGKEGAITTANNFSFTDYDNTRLVELRNWIKTRSLIASETDDTNRNTVVLLSNITDAGRYNVGCKVLKVDIVSGGFLFLVVTNCSKKKLLQNEAKEKEVRICVVSPTEAIKTIPLNTNVILHNVEVEAHVIAGEQEQTVLFYKMVGPLGTYKELLGYENEAVSLTKELQRLEESEELNTTGIDVLKRMYEFSQQFINSLQLPNNDEGTVSHLLLEESAKDYIENKKNNLQSQRSNRDFSEANQVTEKNSNPNPNTSNEMIKCRVSPSTSKSNSKLSVSPKKINREVAVSHNLQINTSPSSNKLGTFVKERDKQGGKTSEKHIRNATSPLKNKSPNNTLGSDKSEISAKENVSENEIHISTPNKSHPDVETSDKQDSNKTSPNKSLRHVLCLSTLDKLDTTNISKMKPSSKIMSDLGALIVEKHCISYNDEELRNPLANNLLQHEERINGHHASVSNHSKCRLPTEHDTTESTIRDVSQKKMTDEKLTNQDGWEKNIVRNTSSSSLKQVSSEESRKESLLTLLPITNNEECEKSDSYSDIPKSNNPEQSESQQKSLKATSSAVHSDCMSTYSSHPMQCKQICYMPNQQALISEIVATHNKQLHPTSDFSDDVCETSIRTKLPPSVRAFMDTDSEFTAKESSDETYSQFANTSKKNVQFFTSTQSSRDVSSDPTSQNEEGLIDSDSNESNLVASSTIDVENPVRFSILNKCDSEASEMYDSSSVPLARLSFELLPDSEMTDVHSEKIDYVTSISRVSTVFDNVDKANELLPKKCVQKYEKTPMKQIQRRTSQEENNISSLTKSDQSSLNIQTIVTNRESFSIKRKRYAQHFIKPVLYKMDNNAGTLLAESLSLTAQNYPETNNSLPCNEGEIRTRSQRETRHELDSSFQNSSSSSKELRNNGKNMQNIKTLYQEIENRERFPVTENNSSENEEENMYVDNAEIMDFATTDSQSRFSSDIAELPNVIAASISYIKQHEANEETVYALKAWLSRIEPPIDLTEKFPLNNIIVASCRLCRKYYTFRAVIYEGIFKTFCINCCEKGKKTLLNFSYLFRLHLLDENNDSLVVTLCDDNARDFLGSTVESYLGDESVFNQVNRSLSRLILQDAQMLPTNRGPMLKLIITPIITCKGIEYILHNTYLSRKS